MLVLLGMVVVPAVLPASASAGGLSHSCSFRYGVGDYQNVSYEGRTGCFEAKVLIGFATQDGRRRPTVGSRTVRLPESTWRCVTIIRRERHGFIVSSHQITCSAREPVGHRARVRFFFES